MAALAQAIDPGTGNQALADLRLLSVGTGFNATFVDAPDSDWGVGQWAPILIPLMIDGVMGVSQYQCSRLLGGKFFRLQPTLPEPIRLDSAGQVGELIDAATAVDLGATLDWVRNVFAG
jgi:hypothetical protein